MIINKNTLWKRAGEAYDSPQCVTHIEETLTCATFDREMARQQIGVLVEFILAHVIDNRTLKHRDYPDYEG